MEKDKLANEAPDEGGEIALDPELVERFDQVMAFFVGKTASERAWRPIPELGVYLYKPQGQNSQYSPSIYHEPMGTYVRKSNLEQPPDPKRFGKAKQSLAELENLIEEINLSELNRFQKVFKIFMKFSL